MAGNFSIKEVKSKRGNNYHVAEVAAEMGNSAGIVLRHYKKAVRPTEAKRFWQLTPDKVLKRKAGRLRIVG